MQRWVHEVLSHHGVNWKSVWPHPISPFLNFFLFYTINIDAIVLSNIVNIMSLKNTNGNLKIYIYYWWEKESWSETIGCAAVSVHIVYPLKFGSTILWSGLTLYCQFCWLFWSHYDRKGWSHPSHIPRLREETWKMETIIGHKTHKYWWERFSTWWKLSLH